MKDLDFKGFFLASLMVLSIICIYFINIEKDIEVSIDEEIFDNVDYEGILDINLGSKESEIIEIYENWDYSKEIKDVSDFNKEGKMYLFSGNLTDRGYPVEISIRVIEGEVYMINEYYTTKDGNELDSRKTKFNKTYGKCKEMKLTGENNINRCDWTSGNTLLFITVIENKGMERYQEELTWTYKKFQ